MNLKSLMLEAAKDGLHVVAEIKDGATRYRVGLGDYTSAPMTIGDCAMWLEGYRFGKATN